MITLAQGISILDLASDVIAGRVNDKPALIRRLAYLGLDLAPVDELKEYLTAAARERDDLAVDITQDLKFGGQ